MPSPSPDPATAELARIAEELTRLRGSVDAMGQQLQGLTADNVSLRARLDQSERARADLLAQTEHLIELLEQSRRELRAAQAKG